MSRKRADHRTHRGRSLLMGKVGDVADYHGCIHGLPPVNEEDRPDEG